jgi:hypothetical protein
MNKHAEVLLFSGTPQVLDEIVQIITEEKFAGKMVVILAGYEQQVRACGDDVVITKQWSASECFGSRI